MAGIDDLNATMDGAEIDPTGPAGIVNRLVEQLAHTSMEDVEKSSSKLQGHEEFEEGEIREHESQDDMEPRSSETPLKQVLIAYYQNLRRLPPNSQACLASLLQQRKGIQVYAEYNMWLNSRGCGNCNTTLFLRAS
ncbi:hypothetical protein E8E11_004627 [Didymella keratinophila]|nr:hypothetical protein E8E11_004627 [Didymella keratinophila]